jgi:cadmium resistance protein CadD (predicted permease)
MIELLILFTLGFVAFFATGIDDTLAYASVYLEHNQKDHKQFFSLGIIIGTFICLAISIFAGSLMEKYLVINGQSIGHLIGGTVLVSLGLITFFRGRKTRQHKKSHVLKMKRKIKKSSSAILTDIRFIGFGLLLFFATGIDDIIAYSNLILAKGTWIEISAGVLVATFVSLVIALFLAGRLKGFKHTEKIGGGIMILIGLLLALKIL